MGVGDKLLRSGVSPRGAFGEAKGKAGQKEKEKAKAKEMAKEMEEAKAKETTEKEAKEKEVAKAEEKVMTEEKGVNEKDLQEKKKVAWATRGATSWGRGPPGWASQTNPSDVWERYLQSAGSWC